MCEQPEQWRPRRMEQGAFELIAAVFESLTVLCSPQWFTGEGVDAAIICIAFSEPAKICRYGLVGSNDCPERSPKTWELWGRQFRSRKDGQRGSPRDMELLHSVKAESFSGAFQAKEFDLRGEELFDQLELRILDGARRGAGLQLSQITLYTPRQTETHIGEFRSFQLLL